METTMRRPVTTMEVKDMYEMFDNDFQPKEIMEMTGRSKSVIAFYKRKWKAERSIEKDESKSKDEEPATENTTNDILNSDYAEKYRAGDPAVVSSLFTISRKIEIASSKTGIRYESEGDYRTIRVTLTDGTSFEMPIELFSKFVDEGLDVVIELDKELRK